MTKLLKANIKMLFRNRQFILWALMFPLIFTFIFGFFFGGDNTAGTIVVINKSKTQLAGEVEQAISGANLFTVKTDVDNSDEAEDLIRKNKVAVALIIPENFGSIGQEQKLEVIEDPANATTNTILLGLLDKFSTRLTYEVHHIKAPAFIIEEKKLYSKELTYYDFVLAGVLGLALMNSSIVGIAVSMAKYREDKILKRITTTPIKTWWFIMAEVLSRLILNFLQITIILAVGKYFFDAHIYGNLFYVYILALFGAILFQLLGFVIASFTKTTDAANGAAIAFAIPMMFLGGVFFPIDTLPKWLFMFVQYLPIAPLLRLIRTVILEGASPFVNQGSNIAIVLAWIVGCLLLASWRFRLSEE